jgi:hypothetical protein
MVISGPILSSQQTSAVSAAGFDPGRIIDDAIFYDPAGMKSVGEVQNFLNAHVPACDTWGTGKSGYGNLTNAQYAQQIKGWPAPPYVCLNNYYENPTTGETSYERGGGAFEGGQSSAQIIYDAAQQYKINPKVLLVMLRKESLNLFSDSWPMKSQYKYAMGYACPDSGANYSAACVDSKAGFYKQMTLAAWQLRYYYNNMGSYNFAPGRWNTIQYSPQPSCGTKSVYIQNNATASLYIYTPYTPNDAALNAYPGTAPCGAYGNRNFYFFWQEWFGSTLTNGNFVRSADNATVYLVGNKLKYPVADVALLGAAGNLGGVGFVSQAYLDNIPTGPLFGRTIQSPDGTIYYFDTNIKLPFTSCALVSDYGGSCGGAAELSQSQIDKFTNGPLMTKGMKTTSGKTYYVSGGMKSEVLDDQSLAASGISVGYNTLTDGSLVNLAVGAPFIRDGVVVSSRQDTNRRIIKSSNQNFKIDVSQLANPAFSTIPTGVLESSSIDKLPTNTSAIGDSFKDSNGTSYILTQDGKKQVQDSQSFGSITTQLPNSLVNLLNGSGPLSNPALLKTSDNSTVYVIVSGQKRPLIAMEDLKSITGQDNPYIGWTTGSLLSNTQAGNVIVGAGRLVKTPSNATVYMTDGYDKLVPMSNFNSAYDVGLNSNIRIISDEYLSKYTVDPIILSSYVSCGGVNYLGLGGVAYQISISGKIPRVLQTQTCNVLAKSTSMPRFVNGPDGTIYELSNGVLHPITSWSKYLALSATGGNMIHISATSLLYLPVGSII